MSTPWKASPTVAQLQAANVNVSGVKEIIWQPIFDFAVYAAAGQQNIKFFQNAAGAGGKTQADTNMQQGGQFPAGTLFALTGIEIPFNSGATIYNEAAVPIVTGQSYADDVQAALGYGAYLVLTIGNKQYLIDGPLVMFPSSGRLYVSAAIAIALPAAETVGTFAYAAGAGMPYDVTGLYIPSNQNFDVTLYWPALVPLPSTKPGRIGCRLNGYIVRNVQ